MLSVLVIQSRSSGLAGDAAKALDLLAVMASVFTGERDDSIRRRTTRAERSSAEVSESTKVKRERACEGLKQRFQTE